MGSGFIPGIPMQMITDLQNRVAALEAAGGGGGGSQTPWRSDIDGAGYNLLNTATVQSIVGMPLTLHGSGSGVGVQTVFFYVKDTSGGDIVLYLDTATGNLGLQNINPMHALDVVGDVNCTGQFMVNGTPLTKVLEEHFKKR